MWLHFLSLWMKPECVTIQMTAIEQYFHVVLFITLYKVVLTFKSVNEILVCDHSNDSYWAVLLIGAVCFWQFCKMKFEIFYALLNLTLLGAEGSTRYEL